MAEFAIATGIVQVAGAGIALTKALYNFGATTSSAGEQTDFIGKNITLYCRVLKTLGQQLKVKQPDHTTEALDLARELQEQSKSLFQKIQKLLPTPEGDRSGLSLKQRILWNFRRNRVDYLVGQLEYLKSTVNLLLNILSSVPKLRRHRRSKKKSRAETEEIKETLNEVQNLIYERCQAQRQLPILAERAERDSAPMLPAATSSELVIANEVESNQQLIKSTGPTLRQIDAYAAGLSGSDDRAMIMQKTSSWVAQLYSQWTTLSEGIDTEDVALFDEDAVANLTADTGSETAFREDSNIKEPRSTRVDNAAEPPEAQQESLSIYFEDGYHHHNEVGGRCNCIRAKLKMPRSLHSELRDVDIQATRWLNTYTVSSLQSPAQFLQISDRRNELEHTYHVQYLLPLYKKYLARLTDLCAITDSELAELYRQSEEAVTNSERQKMIAHVEIPALVHRRNCISRLVGNHGFSIGISPGGTVVLGPSLCWTPENTDARQNVGTTAPSGSTNVQLDPEMIFNTMGGSRGNTRAREVHLSSSYARENSKDMPSFTRSKTMPSIRKGKAATSETSPGYDSEASDGQWGSPSSSETGDNGRYGSTRDSRNKTSAWKTVSPGMSAKMALKFQAKAKHARDCLQEKRERERREKELVLEEEDRYRRFQSPERRSERPERPRVVTSERPMTSRHSSSKVDSRLHEIPRASVGRSGRASPPMSRHSSGM